MSRRKICILGEVLHQASKPLHQFKWVKDTGYAGNVFHADDGCSSNHVGFVSYSCCADQSNGHSSLLARHKLLMSGPAIDDQARIERRGSAWDLYQTRNSMNGSSDRANLVEVPALAGEDGVWIIGYLACSQKDVLQVHCRQC
jgi:hypothetical protein